MPNIFTLTVHGQVIITMLLKLVGATPQEQPKVLAAISLTITFHRFTEYTSLGVLSSAPETIYPVKRREIIMGIVTASRVYIVRIFCSF